MAVGVHLITGGFPPGQPAGHDMVFVRKRLLAMLDEHEHVRTTIADDFTDVDAYLSDMKLMLTYVAGPFPNESETAAINRWLEQGGRWLGLHGTSGGKAARIEGRRQRAMVRTPHHDTLGAFFLGLTPGQKTLREHFGVAGTILLFSSQAFDRQGNKIRIR